MNERLDLQALYSDLRARGSPLSLVKLSGLSPEYLDPRYRSRTDQGQDNYVSTVRPSPLNVPIHEYSGQTYAPYSVPRVHGTRSSSHEFSELSPENIYPGRNGDGRENTPRPHLSPGDASVREHTDRLHAIYRDLQERGSRLSFIELAGLSPEYLPRYRSQTNDDDDPHT